MTPIDIPTIERQARALRAQEIQRLQGLFAERLRLAFPGKRQSSSAKAVPTLAVRLNRQLRRLFAWNPQAQRHC